MDEARELTFDFDGWASRQFQSTSERLDAYRQADTTVPVFFTGAALDVLREVPDEYFDCAMTSPPYWGHRQYAAAGIGQEKTFSEYIDSLCDVLVEVGRTLKPSGSLWLNIGDTYAAKNLLGIPWRVAMKLTDEHGFILRNDVIWHKVKGAPDNAKDKLRNVHEHVFHFVKRRSYYYDVDEIRRAPRQAKVENGRVISATGVSGIRYRRQIELSTALAEDEKENALLALDTMLDAVRTGEYSDFRMIIRGQQRTTHSDAASVSGRARELEERGFYFLKYHPNGSKPGDVWDIIPEDTQKREAHFAPYPEDLCKRPILATCPNGGIVLDPFCGTGTTMKVARSLERKSVGIDVAEEYIRLAERRFEP